MSDGLTRFTIAAVAFMAAMYADISACQASGNAPWCLMIFGDDIYWDCQYRTAAECMASIAAGNRGSCNENPAPGPSAPAVRSKPQKTH